MSLKHIETLRSLTFIYYTLEPLKALNLQEVVFLLLTTYKNDLLILNE